MPLPDRAFMVIPPSGGPVKFMTYEEYIVSPEWRERVNAMKEAAGWRCTSCGAVVHLTGHHKHYLNLGHEAPEDIEILCWPCHRTRHESETS